MSTNLESVSSPAKSIRPSAKLAAAIAVVALGASLVAPSAHAATAKSGGVCKTAGAKTGVKKPLVCTKTSKGLRWALAKKKVAAKDTTPGAAKDTVAPDTVAASKTATSKKPVAAQDTVAPDTTAPKK